MQMKIFKLFYVLCLFGIVACNSENMEVPEVENNEPSFTWTYDGVTKTAITILGESWTSSGGKDFDTRRLFITGTDSNGEVFKVSMINALDLGVGDCPKLMTYQLSSIHQNCDVSAGGYDYCQEGHISLRKNNGDSYEDEDKGGQVILTSCLELDTEASGTFVGTVEDTKDGVLDIIQISGSFENVAFDVL